MTSDADRNQNSLLDVVSTSVAGMRDGVGPLLAVFLIQNTTWSAQTLSWVLSIPNIVNLCAQIPAGILFDRSKFQGALLACGGVFMAAAAFGLSTVPPLPWLAVFQLLAGLACALISVGVTAASLTTATPSRIGGRLARNEIFSKIGNFGAIAITGYIAQTYSLRSMFNVLYLLTAALVVSSLLLKKATPRKDKGGNTSSESTQDIIDEAESEAAKQIEQKSIISEGRLKLAFFDRNFRAIVITSCIYQLANASQFFIFEQTFVRNQANGGAGILSISLFATQVVIILASLTLARWTKQMHPLRLIEYGFLLIALRAIIFSFQFGLLSLAIAQILDGCIAAILIIVPARAIAALNQENFNSMSGALGMCVVFGATASNLLAGLLINYAGCVKAYLAFCLIAGFGALINRRMMLRLPVLTPNTGN